MLFVEHDMDMVHDISDWVRRDGRGPGHRRGHGRRRSRGNQDVIDAYLGAHHDVDLGAMDERRR